MKSDAKMLPTNDIKPEFQMTRTINNKNKEQVLQKLFDVMEENRKRF